MDYVILLGLIAGSLTTVAYLPQVIKAWRTKSTKDVSLWMFILFCVGVFLWLVYGIIAKDLPLVVANIITFILASIILVFKIRYG